MEGQEAKGQGRYIMKWSALDFCHSQWLSTTVRDFSKRNCERAHAGITESGGSGEGQLPSAASSNSPSDFGNEEGEGRNHAKTAREQGGSTED